MSDPVEMARITITRALTDSDNPETADLIGIDVPDEMSAVEALGMLELAKDYILRDRWEENE